jgi:hypothetical protein
VALPSPPLELPPELLPLLDPLLLLLLEPLSLLPASWVPLLVSSELQPAP